MNEMACLGLDFLSNCSESHLTEHFLFNFGIAIPSLAIIISIFGFILEKRFRVRISLKGNLRKQLIFIFILVIILSFVGAILPYISGRAILLIGYPIFWEIISTLLLFYGFLLSFNLFKPVKKLSKRNIKALHNDTCKYTHRYYGGLDLMLREAESFWEDFLHKSIDNDVLKGILLNDFSRKDFLSTISKSGYILKTTVDFIEQLNFNHKIKHVKIFLRKLIYESLVQEESILGEDLESNYKDLTQYIIREKKMSNVIFDDLFLFNYKDKNLSRILNRFISIFHLYLGRKYHYTEEDNNYIDLIESNILKYFFKFFESAINYLDYDQKYKFLSQLSSSFSNTYLEDLPEEKSIVLAEGIYNLLEKYAQDRDWTKKTVNERSVCYRLFDTYITCNQYTKKAFETKLLEKIIGSKDKKSMTFSWYNLKGYYPTMVPIYFFLYGHGLFSKTINLKENEMHIEIIKKMQKYLPILASGKIQEYIELVDMPKDQRKLRVIKEKAERCLANMFLPNIIYNREENSITYIFGGQVHTETILLNESSKEDKIIFAKE